MSTATPATDSVVAFRRPNPVVLYIIMRDDLASMNPGKGMAQAAHAANQCVYKVLNTPKDHPYYGEISQMLTDWSSQADAFGTTIVLSASLRKIDRIMEWLIPDTPLVYGTITDPTYPLQDGPTTHLIPLTTCAYIFGQKKMIEPYVFDLNLHA